MCINDNLKLFFKDNLKKFKFKKSKKYNTWYKQDGNTYFILNLQKSRWGDAFYFNIGITYTELEQKITWDNLNPSFNMCNTSSRAEMYIEDYHLPLKQLMLGSTPNNVNTNTRQEIFDYIMNFFKENKTKELFKQNYKKYYLLDNVGIELPLKEYCEN